MEKINICYFIGSMKIGGAQKHLVELINNLDKDSFNLYLVLAEKNGEFLDKLELDKSNIFLLKLKRYYNFYGIYRIFVFSRFLKKNKIDVLHSYLFECNVYAAITKLMTPRTKLVISIRNMNLTHGKLKVFVSRIASYFSNYITVVCKKVGEYVIDRERFNPRKITTIYNAVDTKLFSLSEEERYIREEDLETFNLVCVASLNFRKGQEYLIRAVANLINKGKNINLHLFGDGKNKDKLMSLVEKLGMTNEIKFYGYISDVRKYLPKMHVGILSSYEEGMSNALLEYMSMEMPVVTTDVGGNAEVNIDGLTGFVIPAKNIDAMENAILKLVEDPKIYKTMSLNARKRIDCYFTISKMCSEYKSFYLNTVMKI